MKRQLITRAWMLLLAAILAIPLAAQTIAVDVTQEGGLWDALEAQGVTNFAGIKSLKVIGVMGSSDFLLIKNQMSNLEVLDISGTSVTEIPNKSFYQKDKLKIVRLPEEITYIRDQAFYNCPLLESVTFGNQAVVEGKIVFPASLRYVDGNAFHSCNKLTHLDFSACTILECLGGSAFQNLSGLQEVLFPNQGNLRLEWFCFGIDNQIWDETTQQWIYKGLENLMLSKAVSYLSGYALPRTLKTLYIESSTPAECSEETFNHFFENGNPSLKVYVPKGSKRDYAIANGWGALYQYMQEMGIQLGVTGFGTLQMGNRTYTDGDVFFANQGGATALKAVPEIGCELVSVKINGSAASVASDGTFTIPTGTTIGTLDIAFTANPTTIDNPNGGELYNNIKALGVNPKTLRSLQVTGTLNARDWQNIRNNMPILESLDLTQTNITSVPNDAIREHSVIKSVALPNSVTKIGENAFYNCQQLVTIDGCENVKEIGSSAFGYCTKLTNFPFGNSIKSIESSAFYHCTSLPETLIMPASLNTFGWGNVFNESSIHNFDLSQCTLTGTIADNTFGECTSLLLPVKGEYVIRDHAFEKARLIEFRLPTAVSGIWGDNIFPTVLKHLYVSRMPPIGVSSNTFYNINLEECTLYVPMGAIDAYEEASYWSEFSDIKEHGFKIAISGFGAIKQGNATYSNGDVYMPTQSNTALLSAIPDRECQLISVTINENPVSVAADGTFTIPAEISMGTIVVKFTSNQIVVDNPNGDELKDMIAAMGGNARSMRALKVVGKMTTKDWNFVKSNMLSLEIFDISETDVKTIPESALQDHQKLTIVHLPSSVITIGNSAFYNCPQLTMVDGCERVKEIGSSAFGYCRQLANFPFGNEIRSIESDAFCDCASLPGKLTLPASVYNIGWAGTFRNSSVRELDLSQCHLTSSISQGIFYGATSVLLPEYGNYNVDLRTFEGTEITELSIPTCVTYIGEYVVPATLERLYARSATPIRADAKAFIDVDLDACVLYVPIGSKDAYAEAVGWSGFSNIKEYGMQVIIADQGKVRVGTQTLQGTSIYFPMETAATFEVVPNAGWHAEAVTLDGADIPFANNKFTLNGDQLAGKLAVTFAANQFNLQLQIAGSGQVKLGSLVYAANQTLPVDSLATLNFTLEPAAGQVVSGITFNGKESVVQNGGTTYVTPAITAYATLAITFGASGEEGDVATYTVVTGEGGSVEYKNTTLLSETTIQLPKGQDAVFAIKPEQYFIVEAVKLNGKDITGELDASGNLTVKNVQDGAALEVAFRVNAEISVVMEDGGSLSNILSETQKKNVTKLTIKGPMWEQDFYTMRDEMPQLEEIDLWEAETEYIPYQAFCSTAEWWSTSVGKRSLISARLPEGTRRIGNFAFAGCSNLKEVNFAELTQLESLEGRTFAQTNLSVIDLSKTKLTDLGGEFYQVKNLENIKLPKTLTRLGDVFRESTLTEIDLSECTNLKTLDGTFYSCKNLMKVVLPEGLTSITGSAFCDCKSLSIINFPKSLQNIGGASFQNSNIQKADLSFLTELQSIGESAFNNCQELTEVLFPSSLVQLGNYAFIYCSKLTSIDLSKTQVQNIPERTFESCSSLESFKLPKTLETIGSSAFAWNNKLGGVLELGPKFSSIGEYAFADTQISIIKSESTTPPVINENTMSDAWVAAFVPEGYAETYKSTPVWEDRVILDHELHAEVTVSYEGNLANDIVEQAKIAPAQVTHLKVHGPIGAKDFAIMRSNMTLLYDLDLEDAECSIIPEFAFLDKKVLMNVKLPSELLVIQQSAFQGCSSLKGTLTLPEGVTTIGWEAFRGCSSLENVELSDALEVIRGYAFEGCSSLQQEITFPKNFTSLGEYAFANCRSLYGTLKFNSEFYMFMGNEGYWSSTGRTFENCSNIEVVDMSECENLYQLPQGIFSRCTSLQTVKLPPYLERIEYHGFEENTSLFDIEFPSSLMYIDGNAFQNCSSLTRINLSDCSDFGTLGEWAFANCASLESANLPASLNWIGAYAFSGCRKLGEINVEALNPADLGEYVFQRVHTERCVLSIPTGTYSEYLSAPQWGEFVSMRKAIDVTLDEGAALTYTSGGETPAYARLRDFDEESVRRAPVAENQQGNVNVKDGSSLYVAENENVTFYINPEENVSIKQVLFNGEDVTNQLQANSFVTPGLTENTSFKVLLNVDGPITVKALRMFEQNVNILQAESRKLVANVYPTNATDKTILWSSSDEKVATVAADGTVTGNVAGRTIITAKTKDGGFEKQCELVVMSNDYYVTLSKEVNTYVDNMTQVPMLLHNADAAQGIQFDVYLPEGLTMRNEWSDDYGIELSGRSNGHSVTASRRSDGSVRVVVYSLDGKPFRANDGQLLSLPIGTREKVGDYDVEVKNIHVSGPNSFDFSAPDYKTRVHVADYPLGDSNGNGEVTVSDATNTVDYILERYTERFVMKAADVNEDEIITVSDVTAAIDIILERPASSAMRKAMRRTEEPISDKLVIDNCSMTNGQQQTVDLKLTNPEQYIAFQCDIMLPEGLTVATNEQQAPMVNVNGANADSHVVLADYVSSGALRLVVMSMNNSTFASGKEDVVSLTIEANPDVLGQQTIDVQNVRLVSVADRQECEAPDTRATIQIVEPSTGFDGIATGNNMQVTVDGREIVIISDTDAVINLVRMNGTQRILNVNAGENRFYVDQPGVYVIQGHKIMVK